MARLNTKQKAPQKTTHEGGPAFAHIKPIDKLRRSVLSCLLWEREFYEDGKSIAERIWSNAAKVTPQQLSDLAREARHVMHLRHVPLLLLVALVRHGKADLTIKTIESVITRADEMGEFLSLYWATPGNKHALPRAMRLGLQKAFVKFDEYQLAKYDRDGAVKLRDVLRLARPKPTSDVQAALWKRVTNRTLKTPDTWEVALSGGADKKQTFERLLRANALGYLALLRNLRNMLDCFVDEKLIKDAIIARGSGAQRVLPFRYIAAARAAPRLEPSIDKALLAAIGELPELDGVTTILVDVSGSMTEKLSGKSDLSRIDAAAALASIWPGETRLYSFDNSVEAIPPRKGMAGVDAIMKRVGGGTELGHAVEVMNSGGKMDRLIVITDEQTRDRVPAPLTKRAYMINVGSAKNGVGYGKPWVHLDGFSEGVLRYIYEIERAAF